MSLIKWTAEMETGVPFVDKDHEILVSLLNQLHDSICDPEEKATLGSVLNALVDYTEYHFSREEKLLEVAHYPDLPAHRARHAHLKNQVYDIQDKFTLNPYSIKTEAVLNFLKSWLVDHILDEDMAYRPFVLSNARALQVAEATPFNEPVKPEERVSPLDWATLKVLIVDDNENFRRVAETIFRSIGVQTVHAADSAVQGLKVLEDEAVDMILCDWRMNGMDGIAFVRAIREKGTHAKVLLCSGYEEEGLETKAKAAGIDELLVKPISAHGLLEKTARLVMGL